MEVLYHIRAYVVGIFPYIGLKNRPDIYIYIYVLGTSNKSVKWPLNQLTSSMHLIRYS